MHIKSTFPSFCVVVAILHLPGFRDMNKFFLNAAPSVTRQPPSSSPSHYLPIVQPKSQTQPETRKQHTITTQDHTNRIPQLHPHVSKYGYSHMEHNRFQQTSRGQAETVQACGDSRDRPACQLRLRNGRGPPFLTVSPPDEHAYIVRKLKW